MQELAAAFGARLRQLRFELLEPAAGGPATQADRNPVAEHLPALLAQPVRGLAHGPTVAAATLSQVERGRRPLLAGLASLALLGACFKWAHDFGVVSDLLIGSWILATAAALVTAVRARPWTLAARTGLVLGLVSVGALVFAGVAFALGEPPNSCGGG